MSSYYMSGLHKTLKCVSLRKSTLIYEILVFLSEFPSHIEHTIVLF